MINYFAYGATVNQEHMKRVVKDWFSSVRAVLRGYKLVFNSYSAAWRGGVAGLSEDPEGVVYGVLYTLSDEKLAVIDRYEGVPVSRLRIRVDVSTESGTLPAFTHVSSNPRTHVMPSKQYLSVLLRGLRQAGYGEDVIRLVEKVAKS